MQKLCNFIHLIKSLPKDFNNLQLLIQPFLFPKLKTITHSLHVKQTKNTIIDKLYKNNNGQMACNFCEMTFWHLGCSVRSVPLRTISFCIWWLEKSGVSYLLAAGGIVKTRKPHLLEKTVHTETLLWYGGEFPEKQTSVADFVFI